MCMDSIVDNLVHIIEGKAGFNLVNMQNPLHILKFPSLYTYEEKLMAYTIVKDQLTIPLLKCVLEQVEDKLLQIKEEDWVLDGDL